MHACIQVFQHMNLRHLPVVDHLYRPVGIITRENLTASLLHRTAKAYLDKEDTSVAQPRYKNVYAAVTEVSVREGHLRRTAARQEAAIRSQTHASIYIYIHTRTYVDTCVKVQDGGIG